MSDGLNTVHMMSMTHCAVDAENICRLQGNNRVSFHRRLMDSREWLLGSNNSNKRCLLQAHMASPLIRNSDPVPDNFVTCASLHS